MGGAALHTCQPSKIFLTTDTKVLRGVASSFDLCQDIPISQQGLDERGKIMMGADRPARSGDSIRGMSVLFATGFRWDGEFHAVYGDRKVANFLSECSEPATEILLELDSGETVYTTYIGAMLTDAA